MDKILNVAKTSGKTSRDIVNELTHILGTKKIGHTGTLDPLASGVLVCLVGRFTKLEKLITHLDKEYIAKIKLGIKTDTGDITGKILDEKKVFIDKDKIIKVFNEFPKKYLQEVPKYSAVKINGKKLYQYARENIDIELPKREVFIYSLEILDIENDTITFKAIVSKGTYIRSLINDLCNNMGIIGTMMSLKRTRQGNFKLEDSSTTSDILIGNYKSYDIKDVCNLPVIEINNSDYKKINNGVKIPNTYNVDDKVLFTYQNEYIAIYEKESDNLLKQYCKLNN